MAMAEAALRLPALQSWAAAEAAAAREKLREAVHLARIASLGFVAVRELCGEGRLPTVSVVVERICETSQSHLPWPADPDLAYAGLAYLVDKGCLRVQGSLFYSYLQEVGDLASCRERLEAEFQQLESEVRLHASEHRLLALNSSCGSNIAAVW